MSVCVLCLHHQNLLLNQEVTMQAIEIAEAMAVDQRRQTHDLDGLVNEQ